MVHARLGLFVDSQSKPTVACCAYREYLLAVAVLSEVRMKHHICHFLGLAIAHKGFLAVGNRTSYQPLPLLSRPLSSGYDP